MTLTVCVYCGSRNGASPAFRAAAQALGRLIGERGWRLVYGGGNVGLMGVTADAALAAGAEVVGVIPERLVHLEVGHRALTELHVVPTMHERKRLMAELADVFVALPGGIGTFEELFEVWTWRHLGYHDRPLGLLETAGYWAPMVAFLRHSVAEGFMGDDQLAMLHVNDDIERLLDQLSRGAGNPLDDDFSRI